MGSGVSKPNSTIAPGRHSDSRVDQVRSELAKEALGASIAGGNSTFTLSLSLHEYATGKSAPSSPSSDQPDSPKKRAHSLPGLNYASIWGKCGPSSSPIQTIGSLEEIQDEVDLSDKPANAPAPVVNNSDGDGNGDADDDGSEDYEDDFEDEIGDWKKGDSIGSGSYGTVYLARDERTGGLMAVKEILIADENDADISNATREVDLLRSLRDDHIVKYLGSYVDDDAKKLFIFTEWVPGGNLEQNRKKYGGNETIVRRFTQQILHGVAYLHSKNIVHHDIKPSNILVDQHGTVKLADFGASRLISSSTCVNNETMRGTPNYMAPEVIKQSSRSRKSDIWSVGCSVLRLLTGLPFWGDKKFDSQISLLYYVANLETLPALPGELSDDAKSFVAACLEIDPVLRPSALELMQHPFVKPKDASKALRSSRSNNTAVRAIRTAPVATGSASRTPNAAQASKIPSVSKRVVTTAPSQLNLPRLRNGGDVAAPTRQNSYIEAPLLPNAFDLPDVSSEDGEASIPSFSTTVFPLVSQGDKTSPSTQKKPKNYLLSLGPNASSTVSYSGHSTTAAGAEYTFSDFESVAHQTKPKPSKQLQQLSSPSKWDEQPITLTDAARVEREQRLAQVAAEKLKREERERRYQEELAEFRRQMGH